MQEQREVTTPVLQKKVVIRGYQPARLRQKIQTILLRGKEIDPAKADELSKNLTVPGERLEEVTNTTLEHMVLSVDGQSQNILDIVGDLPEEDFDFIVAEVEKAKGPLAKQN